MKLQYIVKHFEQLTLDELYEFLALRQEVFVVEQDCPYLDADGLDKSGYHVMGYNDKNELCAYTRLLDKGLSYDEYCSIGRVITSSKVRGEGIGYELMNRSMAECKKLFGQNQIKISAQEHLEKFYNQLGFQRLGSSYLEDGIPHIAMLHATQ